MKRAQAGSPATKRRKRKIRGSGGGLYCVQALEPRVLLSGGLAGYYTDFDSNQHAIVATADGSVNEIYFNPTTGIFKDVLGYFRGVTAIAAYYTPQDGFEHAIVAGSDGDLTEIYFNPQRGIFEDTLAHFNGIIAIAGFVSPDDNYQHVIVGTQDGNITEVYFNPQFGVFQAHLAQYSSPIVAIGGFFSSDDNYRHAIVATADGNVHEIYYNPANGVGQTVLANLGGIVDVAGFFTPDDNFRHVIVGTSDGKVHEIYYNPSSGIGQDVLASLSGVLHVGGYFTPNDNYRHALVETPDHSIHEIFFNPAVGIGQDVLASFSSQPPTAVDISPNLPAGTVQARPSTAGLTVGIAGDTSALYAVSLNAGVWKSVNNGPWAQLPNSPPRAYDLAIDPNDHSHLAVGERAGDSTDSRVDDSGVWESHDSGGTWSHTLNPLSLPGCTTQAIPALAFAPTSTLFVGTDCGIGRKPAGATSFDFSHSPAGIGLVSAITASQTKIWARTQDKLLVSSDDGLTWTLIPIPTLLDGFHITFESRGDLFSLAAFDSIAVLPFKPDPDTTANHNTVLIYNAMNGSWLTQVLDTGDGTGLGGRRFAKAFILNRPDLPATIGQRLRLYVGVGQEIEQAVGVNVDGTLQWTHFAQAMWGGPYGYPPNDIHSDIWDFNIQSDLRSWVAGDGGVYTNDGSTAQWVSADDGLHTHHVHTLVTIPVGHVNRPKLAYPTSDNDHWWRDSSAYAAPAAAWQGVAQLGDVNWSAADAGNPGFALLVRTSPGFAGITSFGHPPPTGANFTDGQRITINNDATFDGPLGFQFIQTLKSESPQYPLGDAVMLTNLPLKTYVNNQLTPVPGPLGQANPNGGPVLIRSTQFASNPDANLSQFQNWSLVANNLPAGTLGFWVSGGHASPTYYLYARDLSSGSLVLYKGKGLGAAWEKLYTGLLPGGEFGPAFVNPYDPNQVYILTPAGVKASSNGGASFTDDSVLTSLITGSGQFPLGTFYGGNGTDVTIASRSNAMGTLSDMAFNPDDPREVVAASPYTGVFYTDGDGTWRDLTPAMPRPISAASAVEITDGAVYVATEGRSVLAITGFRNAVAASYFSNQTADTQDGPISTLLDAHSSPLSVALVHLRVTTPTGQSVFDGTVNTDASGRVFVPNQVPGGTYVFSLQFNGDSATAPSQTAFVASHVVPRVANAGYAYDRLPHAITFTFDQNVVTALAAVQVTNLSNGTMVVPVNFSFDAATHTATFAFAGSLPSGNYRATLLASAVSDAAGRHPVADYNFDFFFLTGDVNHDRAVDFSDLLILARHYGMPGAFADGDLNYDGTIGFDDLVIVARNYGRSISPATAAAAIFSASVVGAAPSSSAAATPFEIAGLPHHRRRP